MRIGKAAAIAIAACRTRPAPAVHSADADRKKEQRPGEEAEEDAAEDGVAAAVVVAAGPEEVLPVHRDADRPEDEKGERERRRGQREQLPRAPVVAEAAETARRAVEEPAAEPVRRDGVEGAGDEREDWHEDQIDGGIVEHAAEGRACEHHGDAGEHGDRDERFLSCIGNVLVVLAKRREDRAGRNEDERRAQPPAAVQPEAPV